jgi:tripeptidyl-peptidase-1
MRFFTIAAVAASVALSVQGAAVPSHGVHLAVHERRSVPHREWIKRSRIPSKTKLPVRIGLKQRNLEKGHDYLMDV